MENPQFNNVAATALWLSGNLVFAKEIYKSVHKLFIVFAREEKNLPFVYLTCLRSDVSPCGHIACVIKYVAHCSKLLFFINICKKIIHKIFTFFICNFQLQPS